MLLRILGIAGVLLAIAAGNLAGQGQKQADKEIVGKVKEVDAKKKTFILTLGDKGERTFLVTKETKFIGPRGAEHEEGLRDEAMAAGNEVRVVPAADEQIAKEVKLGVPIRKKGKG